MSTSASSERTRNYLHQIKGTVICRALAMAASFAAIPLMIGFLGEERFGIWSTLLSIMSWIVFFDLGVGNGLRNKVAESLARNEMSEAARYVSSGYTLIGLIALAVWMLIASGSYFIPWQRVFNTHIIPESTLRNTIQIATFFIMLNFWIGLITALLGAIQRTSLIAIGQVISNLLTLVLVFILARITNASISHLAFVYGLSLVTANTLLSLWFYQSNCELRPRFQLELKHIRPMLAVGLQFFIIQLAVLIIFTTDKVLITQLFGPQYVTQYEVVFKLFSVITLVHGMISMPLWSAYTDAFHRNDLDWIRYMLRKQLKIYAGIVMGILLLTLLAKPIIAIWIDHRLDVPPKLILAMGLFVLISTWCNIYAIFVNGIGRIKLQLYTSIVAMFVNVPLSIYFAKNTELGVSGIVAGTICSLLLGAIALPFQVYSLIKKRSKSRSHETPNKHSDSSIQQRTSNR